MSSPNFLAPSTLADNSGRERFAGEVSGPFVSLQREIDRLFDHFTRGSPIFSGLVQCFSPFEWMSQMSAWGH